LKKLVLFLFLAFLLSTLVSCTKDTTTINSLQSNFSILEHEELGIDSVSQLIKDFVEVYKDKRCFSYFVDPNNEEITVAIFSGVDTKDSISIKISDVKELKDKTIEITVQKKENSTEDNSLPTYQIVKFKPSLQIPKIVVKDTEGEIYPFLNKVD